MVDVPGRHRTLRSMRSRADVPSGPFYSAACTTHHRPPDPDEGSSLRAVQRSASNSIQAWPWVEGTASWVEPTAWCLLLLKKVRSQSPSPEADERIRVGEQFLFDRVCRDEGWTMATRKSTARIWPYVPTTAVALLAMRTIAAIQSSCGVWTVAERCSERALCRRRCAHYRLPSRVWSRDEYTRTDCRRVVGSGRSRGSPWDRDDALRACRYQRARGIQVLGDHV